MADNEPGAGRVKVRQRLVKEAPPRNPRHDTASSTDAHGAISDPDTCRICRGEPTPTEPLFYPCKCSGSIKYVHQECLMEWLSHSQKKHCELCKTPFRFTKLYSPKMPKSLPAHIFVGHMAKYLFDNVMFWLRALLVACVWLCWLPYLMRRVWCLLFWLSDEGLGSLLGKSGTLQFANTTAFGSGLDANTTIAPSLTTLVSAAANGSGELASVETTGSPAESLREVLVSMLLKLVVPSLVRGSPSSSQTQNGQTNGTSSTSSLLGDVSFLRNLTRSPALNQACIMILEGQILTISVIACFILIILVRDYVVQQQPEINMRAAFAAQDNGRLEERRPAPDHGPENHAPENHAPDAEPADNDQVEPEAGNAPNSSEDDADAAVPIQPVQEQRPIAQARRRLQPQVPLQDAGSPSASGLDQTEGEVGQTSSATRSHAPGASEAELNSMPTVQEYMRIYRQAEGDAETILRIMEEENLQDRLDSWVRVTRARLEEERASSQFQADALLGSQEHGAGGSTESFKEPVPQDEVAWEDEQSSEEGENDGRAEQSNGPASSPFPESDQPPQPLEPASAGTRNEDSVESVSQRRRAVSDGPQPRELPHPLANNNWQISHDGRDAAGPVSEPQDENESGDLFRSTAAEDGESFSRFDTPTFSGDQNDRRENVAQGGFEHEPPPAAEGGDAPAIEEAPQIVEPAPAPRRQFLDQVADFFLGGVDEAAVNAQAAPEDDVVGEEGADGFAPPRVMGEDLVDDMNMEEGDPEAVEGAAAAGLDQDALEDLEDFEGILELIGIRGPIIGLFQNAIFCAGLVFVAIFLCIFLPYNIGRTAIWLAANPMRVIRMLFALSSFIQDIVAVIAGSLSCATLSLVHLVGLVTGSVGMVNATKTSMSYTYDLTLNASTRLATGFLREVPIQPYEMQNFSALSHDALISLKGHISALVATVWASVTFVLGSPLRDLASALMSAAAAAPSAAKELGSTAWTWLTNPGTWIIDLDKPTPISAVDSSLAHWDGLDRTWAIASGYGAVAMMATVYVSRASPFFAGDVGQEWEASVVDLINQASGVTKVILIIGIEMLVFPLYCGLLLDAALLPLFEEATIKSRFEFSMNYPTTSMFVHWFVGTGYMFHFALFVSMCRKIMRRGVLYFIRDPDDPDFHPIRDVLEKPFLTQLRKILFSGLVYGGLVIVCLGGVVWGLAMATSHVLPIHYSSNEPVLEFPVDLLFYNFLMPLAVKVLRPSNALHAMYTWWFRRCARMLRLTWFLFGQRQIDEEGTLVLSEDSPHRDLPWFRRMFLGLDERGNVAPKSIWNLLNEAVKSPPSRVELVDVDPPAPADAIPPQIVYSVAVEETKNKLVDSGQLIKRGRFVRAPASDQVRIPRGRRVFFDIDEKGALPTPEPEDPPYTSDQYQTVYIPPHFGTRVFLFILFIWIFAAVTGVGLTIIPLQVGRWMFKSLLPSHVRTNDIYAFSIGMYVLGTLLYSVLHTGHIVHKARGWLSTASNTLFGDNAAMRTGRVVLEVAKFVYAYANVLIVFPLLASVLMELYVIIPLHTWMYPPVWGAAGLEVPSGRSSSTESTMTSHTIRAVQAWTLGLLYLKLGTRMLTTSFAGTRLSIACRAVFQRGWLHPNVAVLTRAFVVPGLALSAVAIAVPPFIARFILSRNLLPAEIDTTDPVVTAFIYRISFMMAATFALGLAVFWSLIGVFHGWQTRIRDEVYLIGERLHNYGVATAGAVKVREG